MDPIQGRVAKGASHSVMVGQFIVENRAIVVLTKTRVFFLMLTQTGLTNIVLYNIRDVSIIVF